MKFGLNDTEISQISSVLSVYPDVSEAIIYGSRVKGTYRSSSDIDLALKGGLTFDVVAKIHAQLNEMTPLPYFFDVLDYNQLSNQDLKEHIDTVGRILYQC